MEAQAAGYEVTLENKQRVPKAIMNQGKLKGE
jgi:hypothetical protein